jgi:hypothetical protein
MGRLTFSLMLLAALVALTTGCGGPTTTGGGKGEDVIVFESEEIILAPGDEKEVKVKSGKAEKAEAPKDSGVTAKAEGDKVTVSASKDAKEGTHSVTVKGDKAKDGTLKVTVKKK